MLPPFAASAKTGVATSATLSASTTFLKRPAKKIVRPMATFIRSKAKPRTFFVCEKISL
jgi:hypothetical protein